MAEQTLFWAFSTSIYPDMYLAFGTENTLPSAPKWKPLQAQDLVDLGSLFLGLGLQMEVEHFRISGNLSNIAGLALPNHTAGLGASIQLTYLF